MTATVVTRVERVQPHLIDGSATAAVATVHEAQGRSFPPLARLRPTFPGAWSAEPAVAMSALRRHDPPDCVATEQWQAIATPDALECNETRVSESRMTHQLLDGRILR